MRDSFTFKSCFKVTLIIWSISPFTSSILVSALLRGPSQCPFPQNVHSFYFSWDPCLFPFLQLPFKALQLSVCHYTSHGQVWIRGFVDVPVLVTRLSRGMAGSVSFFLFCAGLNLSQCLSCSGELNCQCGTNPSTCDSSHPLCKHSEAQKSFAEQ